MTEPDNLELSRQAFEAWISGPPYQRSIRRYVDDARVCGWPGQYRDRDVQLAWTAWCEAMKYQGQHSDLAVQLAWTAWCEARKLRTTHD